jgi:GH24 family phage-related lysozyme (muramidase)
MELSSKGLEKLKEIYGFRARPKIDDSGNLIVGYGHVVTPGDGVVQNDIINTFKGFQLLLEDVQSIVNVINMYVTNITDQDEFDTLVISTFQQG